MSCPQIWNIEQEKDREKEKVGGRPAKLNEKKGDRDLEREIKKQRRHFLLEEQHKNFVKKVNENTYDISSIKKFLEVSRCGRAK